MPLNQLPSVRPLPLSSSCWRWPGRDLSDQWPVALPVRWQKDSTFSLLPICRCCCLQVRMCESVYLWVGVTCCAVFMAKNWCCPSAPHTYPNARLSVTSLAMKEILLTMCSCSITWVIRTKGFISRPNKTFRDELRGNGRKRQNSLPISHQWSWCPTWKCWPRSSVCVCLGTVQLLPYPGVKQIIRTVFLFLCKQTTHDLRFKANIRKVCAHCRPLQWGHSKYAVIVGGCCWPEISHCTVWKEKCLTSHDTHFFNCRWPVTAAHVPVCVSCLKCNSLHIFPWLIKTAEHNPGSHAAP